jgi:hypothetical protein
MKWMISPRLRKRIVGVVESPFAAYRLQAYRDKEQAMASKSRTTTDHDEIRKWVEQHDGKPANVRGTEGSDEAGVLRIDFPGGSSDKLEQISWDDWFAKFDESDLAFLYQEQKASGEDSTFFKLVQR